MEKLVITLTDGSRDYDLTFDVLDISIAHKWLKHLNLFIQAGQPWDDPKRFYNFPNTAYPESVVRERLKQLIATINQHAPGTIDRELSEPVSQDDLNYLHHVFEIYHGLYDQQQENEFFSSSPKPVQDALSDLNIWIHRYETLGGMPRFVATWKYKPYRDLFNDEDITHFRLEEEWGDLRLNYCEIGKTLQDLWQDNDHYINPQAFQPHHHYCFDFTVRFSDMSPQQYVQQETEIWRYFDQHRDFFHAQGYCKHDPRLCVGGITVAKLRTDQSKQVMINNISQYQQLKSIQRCR